MANAYIEEATKQKPVAAIIRPAVSPDRLAAMEIAKGYPRSRVINTQDTPSMLGTGYKNDLVLAPMDDYNPGDDVVYRSPTGGTVLHRITHKKPGKYYLKGTFNRSGDGWIDAERIIGKVVHPKPKW